MDYIKNKYKLPITRGLMGSYIELVINSIFKTLPIYEGKSNLSKEIVYLPEQAYIHYQQHLEKNIVEITGDYYIFCDIPEIISILSILTGMKDIHLDEHDKVKSMVFECIKICEKIKDKLNKESEGDECKGK